jgi:hypothetical protein
LQHPHWNRWEQRDIEGSSFAKDVSFVVPLPQFFRGIPGSRFASKVCVGQVAVPK